MPVRVGGGVGRLAAVDPVGAGYGGGLLNTIALPEAGQRGADAQRSGQPALRAARGEMANAADRAAGVNA